ncbi:creatininase family protein [Laceyella putida]|uniref:Creatininase family protein n=1 Tax=Laceyella putida TaxID=110101 RepID=A0ABW2RKR4_9BACL
MNPFPSWDECVNMELAFFPIGSTEQHGTHLPLHTDTIIAAIVAQRLAERFVPAYVVPALPYSASFEHSGFPGSLSLRVTTITAVVQDVIHSLERSGIPRCVIINGHGGNMLLGNIAQELNAHGHRVMLAPTRKHWERAYEQAGISVNLSQDMHAGEAETSLLMHLFSSGVVKTDKLIDVDAPHRPLLEVVGMEAFTPTGTIGFPSRASANKGKALLNALVREIALSVEEFLALE